MAQEQTDSPAFGTADLTNCEREQIQFAGSIQPHGALLLLSERDGSVVQASANAAEFLRIDGRPHGRHLRDFGGNLWKQVRRYIGDAGAIPIAVGCHLDDLERPLNALLHHPLGGGFVVELEHAGPTFDYSEAIGQAIEATLASSSLKTLCDETARIVRDLAGYDRVMVYRFDDAGHGEVYSECKRPELEAFLGNRYPATDIPQIARRLYERNRVRLLADINFTPSPLEPRFSPFTGEELDMSLCFLRSVSPIHVQYLKNMGVAATLVVSLMVGGQLWGLISCHHYSPRVMHFEMRAVCELLAEVVGTRIAALEGFVRVQSELSVKRLEQRMVENISREGDWKGALLDSEGSLLQPLGATGAALLYEGRIQTVGEAPSTEQIRRLAEWIDEKRGLDVFATSSLSTEEPRFAPLVGSASGVVAARISGETGEMLLWFRKERVRTITWGGNPFKPPSSGDDQLELSPRRSFAQWRQVVEGTSDPWTAADLAAAELIATSVTDVVLQFRSVRILIAQDQLAQVLRQVQSADQPVVVADAEGRVIQTNASFDALLKPRGEPLEHLLEFDCWFADSEMVARKIRALLFKKLPWRGEALLESGKGLSRPFLLRADPVMSSPNRVLGFVLLFTDLTESKAAETARRHFQDDIFRRQQMLQSQIGSGSDVTYRDLMSTVIENAQLAALEITDGVDGKRMPEMLESVNNSVGRAAEVLEQLSAHARSSRPPKLH